ncbi:hypothetical protein GQ600_14851 [Phytophthora cactorum]|nr:hypothetical protein GQ600_14851 [Phytophthora cactorum]
MKKHSNINSCSNIWNKDLLTDSINCSWDEISLFDSDCDLEYEFFRSNEHDSDEELMEEGFWFALRLEAAFPHVPSPSSRKKLKEEELVARLRDDQQGVDEEVATTLATSEYVPRKRTSKHLEELESMGNQYDEVVNIVPAFGESRNLRAGTTSTRLSESTSGKTISSSASGALRRRNVSTGMHELLFNGFNLSTNLANVGTQHEPSRDPLPKRV